MGFVQLIEARIYHLKLPISSGLAQINLIFTILFALILAACGSSTTQVTSADSPTTAPTLVQKSFPTIELPAKTPFLAPTIRITEELSTATPTSIPTILPTPSSIVPFDERQLATVNVDNPDEIAFLGGYIWVKTDDGHLIQVDPSTNVVVGDIKVDTTSDPFHYCQGLGTDGENIWVCSASGDEESRTIHAARVDPQLKDIVETVKVGKIFDQFEMPFLSNQIWVLTNGGDKLVGIDVTNKQLNPVIDLGSRCFQLAVSGKSLLATCALDNLILRITPEKGEVTDRVTLINPRIITATEDGVWVAQDNSIVRLDPDSLDPVVAYNDLDRVGTTGDIFANKEAVWVRSESGFLYRIDPVSNEIIEQIIDDQNLSGGSVLATADSVWTTASDDGLLIRLSLK